MMEKEWMILLFCGWVINGRLASPLPRRGEREVRSNVRPRLPSVSDDNTVGALVAT